MAVVRSECIDVHGSVTAEDDGVRGPGGSVELKLQHHTAPRGTFIGRRYVRNKSITQIKLKIAKSFIAKGLLSVQYTPYTRAEKQIVVLLTDTKAHSPSNDEDVDSRSPHPQLLDSAKTQMSICRGERLTLSDVQSRRF